MFGVARVCCAITPSFHLAVFYGVATSAIALWRSCKLRARTIHPVLHGKAFRKGSTCATFRAVFFRRTIGVRFTTHFLFFRVIFFFYWVTELSSWSFAFFVRAIFLGCAIGVRFTTYSFFLWVIFFFLLEYWVVVHWVLNNIVVGRVCIFFCLF